MRRILMILAILVLGVAFFFLYHGTFKVRAGDPAPVFSLPDERGRRVSLEAFRGKVVVLNFWATWCPPCLAEMPMLENLRKEFSDRPFALVMVNRDSRHLESSVRAVRAFQRLVPFSGTVLYDVEDAAAAAYGVYSIPQAYIIGRDGVVLDVRRGFTDWTDPRISDKIRESMGES